MGKTEQVGKREFIQHTSKYVKLAEQQGSITITHNKEPRLKLVRIEQRSIRHLRGLIKHVEVTGDINDPVLPGYDEW